MKKPSELIGMTFGRLLVISRDYEKKVMVHIGGVNVIA